MDASENELSQAAEAGPDGLGLAASPRVIARLVGDVYDAAPASERRMLIEHLMGPLSLMALLAVADGVFAKLWFRRGWQDPTIRLEDTQWVTPEHVVALVDFVQQASADTVVGIAQVVQSAPAIAATAAATALVAALVRRVRKGRSVEG